VNSDQQNGGLDELLTYDRVTAARWALPRQSLDSGCIRRLRPVGSLAHLYAVEPVLRRAGSRAAVLAEPGRLKNIYFHTAGQQQRDFRGNTPLHHGQASTTPLAINHTGLFPSVTVSFNLAPGVSLSDATLAIDQMQQRWDATTVHGFFAGTLQAYQQSLGTEPISV
jgi:multidrug efflux pump